MQPQIYKNKSNGVPKKQTKLILNCLRLKLLAELENY